MAAKVPVIDLQGITVIRDARVLSNVSWLVKPGEHWAILGANGSGKTSLLSVLAGYLAPTRGTVRFCGQTRGEVDWRELRKRFGVVSSSVRQAIEPQEPADEIVASGREAIINTWILPTAGERKKARSILRQVESLYLADRPWRVLSQGERQRVLIGRALMAELQLLILDEPCAGLDPVARETFLGFVHRLIRRPASPTVLLVTHHVEEIPPSITHVLILKKGRVLAAGPKVEVLRDDLLSEAFGAAVKITKARGRYAMKVQVRDGRAV